MWPGLFCDEKPRETENLLQVNIIKAPALSTDTWHADVRISRRLAQAEEFKLQLISIRGLLLEDRWEGYLHTSLETQQDVVATRQNTLCSLLPMIQNI